jgi:hypothetical protein
MKVKTLICSSLDRFRYADINSLVCDDSSTTEEISSVALQFGPDAESESRILEEVRRAAEDDSDTYVMLCAFGEDLQSKLPKSAPCGNTTSPNTTGSEQLTPAGISAASEEGLLDRIHERLNELAVFTRQIH